MSEQEWTFSYEGTLHDVFPSLLDAQRGWLSAIDSLDALDRKTHELIRLVCMVLARNAPGIRRHARLAAEVGASWEEVCAALVLTEPGFGILAAVEALPQARKGFEAGAAVAAGDAEAEADAEDDR